MFNLTKQKQQLQNICVTMVKHSYGKMYQVW